MRIISFRAENVKRLVAANITPDGNVVEITGKNGAGKTSVLDAIWWALGGGKAIQELPIRKGAETALIALDLGKFTVTRKFRAKEDGEITTSLVVETEDGIKAQNPQKILDAIYSELTFDPLVFTRQKPADQFDTLKSFVPGVDFTSIASANDKDFAARTDVNRRAKELRAQIAGIEVPETGEQQVVDETALVAELEGVGEFNTSLERERNSRATEAQQIATLKTTADGLRNRAADLRRQADAAESEAAAIETTVSTRATALQALPPLATPKETAEVRAKIADARAVNAALDTAARARANVADLTAKATALEAESAALTDAMEKRTAEKEAAIAAAKLPVSGITFGAGEILLNGVPFDQASDAEQLRASIELAAAMNPKLRVIRVRDGSLLDSDSMTLLAALAEEQDMQIWIETVDSGRAGAIVIEDGHVRADVQQAAE